MTSARTKGSRSQTHALLRRRPHGVWSLFWVSVLVPVHATPVPNVRAANSFCLSHPCRPADCVAFNDTTPFTPRVRGARASGTTRIPHADVAQLAAGQAPRPKRTLAAAAPRRRRRAAALAGARRCSRYRRSTLRPCAHTHPCAVPGQPVRRRLGVARSRSFGLGREAIPRIRYHVRMG